MRIKKDKSNNRFAMSQDGTWIRDPFSNSVPIDINDFRKEDYSLLIENEYENKKKNYKILDTDSIFFKNIIIVSNGYGFKNKHSILSSIPKETCIIAVNNALSEWELVGEGKKNTRRINYYVASNPYEECMLYLPKNHRFYPTCLSSLRTNPNFLNSYLGRKVVYSPSKNVNFSVGNHISQSVIEDYRNPICACINLACKFNVQKLMLFCCDNSFDQERPSSVKLENGLWTYEQHIKTDQIIDTLLYWFSERKIQVSNFSSGTNLNNATYIKTEEEVKEFFEE